MEISAKDFRNRKDLERYVQAEMGVDVQANKDAAHIITGTREELAGLRLSDSTTLYGIKCVITDTPSRDFKGKSAQIIQASKEKPKKTK